MINKIKSKFKPVKWEDLYLNQSTNEIDYFELFFQPLRNIAMQYLIKNKQLDNEIILEIGCGNGEMLKEFNDSGFYAIGTDINMILLKSSLNQKNLICCDVHNLPFKSHSLDNIYSFSVLQYCNHDKVFAEIKRVLKINGKMALIENMGKNPFSSLYRIIHKKRGWVYPPFQSPEKYINWNQRKKVNKLFADVSFQSYYLTTPLVMFAFRISPNIKIVHKILSLLFNIYNFTDHVLLTILPFLSKYCWRVVIFATNKE